MTPKKTLAGFGATVMLMAGVDASTLNETPIERMETVANERVEAKQIGNVVETTLPWKGELGLKVKYDMGEPTVAEKFKDKRNKEVITEVVPFLDSEGFKVDILLNEKPSTNVFCYQIEGAENYDFFYQPPLTAEEIAEGAERPENIQGSFAVYHKTLKNHRVGAENYATGKVMHIPRPQVWELNNQASTTEWADLSYSEQDGLCVTARQEFFDKAEYPVRIDPTFGYTSIGASAIAAGLCSSNGDASIRRGTVFTTTEAGTIDSMSVYTAQSSGSNEVVDFQINVNQKDSVAVNQHGQIAQATRNAVTITTTPAWLDFTLAGQSLAASTDYILNVGCDGEDVVQVASGGSPYYDIVASAMYYKLYAGAGAYATALAENPYLGTTVLSRTISIYATYTSSATSSTSTDSGIIWFD